MIKFNLSSDKNITQVIPIFMDEAEEITFFRKIDDLLKSKIINKLKLFNFKFDKLKSYFIEVENIKYLIVCVSDEYDIEELRKVYSQALDKLKQFNENKFEFQIPKEKEDEIISIVESVELTDYLFDKYKKNDDKSKEVEIYLNVNERYKNTIKETQTLTQHVKFTRNIVNENANVLTPIKLEELAKDFAKKHKLKIKVLDEKKIERDGLGLLNAVGCGSINTPRLIILEYCGNSKSMDRIALVGKGITFDTGGLNLKPTGYMETMKTDMGGAATTFGVFRAAVENKLQKNIILVISAAENVVSAKSFKPGDIFTAYNGKTVEIGNTDAEGRLVLADALSYVQKNYNVKKVIDIATLTGASMVALGPTLIAMLGNSDEMKKDIFISGEKTYERVWELPIYDEHRNAMKGKFSDLSNMGSLKRYGGCITAAAFLENFIEEGIDWVHLDIAGASRSNKKEFYISDYGTGKGVRLVYDYLKNN